MAWLGVSRWVAGIANAGKVGRAGFSSHDDETIREHFNLSRWFAGIGRASEDALAKEESPEADRRVRAAVDTLPVTLFEFDSSGTYTSVAGKHVGLFGITPSQIVGRSVFDFPKLVPGKVMMVRRALRGEAVAFTGIWPLGRFMIRLQPRFDAAGRVAAVVGLGFEIGGSTAADEQMGQLLEALRQSEARFRAMCESAPLGIYVTNSKFELGYVNPALCKLLGRDSDELLGRHWQTALRAQGEDPLDPLLAAGDPPGSADERAQRLQHADGSSIWTSLRVAELRDGGELLGYVGAIADVTREREARLAIDRAQLDLRRVIESSREGIAVVRDGRWAFVNRAMCEALGHARSEDLVGQDSGDIVHPDDRSRALALTAELASAATDTNVYELRYRRANGEYALMDVRRAALTEFEGEPAVLITARDITERKRLQAQLLMTERLLSVGTLAAGVAHEINNPLAAALGNLEWVASRIARWSRAPGEDGSSTGVSQSELEQLKKPILDAREAAERVRAIVHDLKLFSRAEEDLEGPAALTPILDSAARMAWHEVRQRARFIREYSDLPVVHGSAARLGQVFLNLIINAAQSIPEGAPDEHVIRLDAKSCANHVVVEVRDTGSGIAPHVIGRIFDPFFTTKPPGVGTGLGLAICHRIVTSLRGSIDVESQPGRGSTFRVTLLRAAPDVEPAAPRSSVGAQPAGTRGRVLVIDDDLAMANVVALTLREDHEVEVFTSARQALECVRRGEHFDAIICDVMMPEMDGIEFHAGLSDIPGIFPGEVVFMTAGAYTVRAREFLDRVANPCLEKPFDAETLRDRMRRQVSRALFRRSNVLG
jgi:two-component system cell cycle sensor histidine kinase/response regulator CckA